MRHPIESVICLVLLLLAPSVGSAAAPSSGSVAAMIFIDTMLVILLLGLGFLAINLGLLSKREVDKIGRRSPSDVAVLKSVQWDQEEDVRRVLPALQDDEGEVEDEESSEPLSKMTGPKAA